MVTLLSVFTGCGYKFNGKHRTIWLENRTSLPLLVYERGYSGANDTVVTWQGLLQKRRNRVEPYSKNKDALKRPEWDTYEDHLTFFQSCQVFIMDATITAWLYDNISNPDAYLVRYDLTLKDIQDLDWRISFPPNDSMRVIHMWPPYEVVVAQYSK